VIDIRQGDAKALPEPYFKTDLGVLYHGDCMEILPLLGPVGCVVTDPPYGMNNNTDSDRFSGGHISSIRKRGFSSSRFKGKIVGDEKPFDPKPLLAIGVKTIIFGYNHFADKLPTGTLFVWIKKYDDAFETFLSDAEMAWMNKGNGVYCKRDTSITGEANNRLHPNQKPLPIIMWLVGKTTGSVLDPFLGSGTTAVACERLGRKWIGIEIDEKYCEIAAKRIRAEAAQRKLF